MTAARVRSVLAILSALLFGALIWLSATYLTPQGYDTFDGSPLGYDLTYAREYLSALQDTDGALALYTGPVRLLDTVFPVVFTGLLVMMLHHASRTWSLVPQLFLFLIPGTYLVMDLAENALVGQILSTNVQELRADLVNQASGFTVSKYIALGASVLALVAVKIGARGK
ncbi:hypothetical protein [Primorskyibacter sp. S187A]|uniref:hypothetical protein n=1 Tax=Primorskyibacter sp. S187A TaxID=3415130 RepID=UPI003C7AD350